MMQPRTMSTELIQMHSAFRACELERSQENVYNSVRCYGLENHWVPVTWRSGLFICKTCASPCLLILKFWDWAQHTGVHGSIYREQASKQPKQLSWMSFYNFLRFVQPRPTKVHSESVCNLFSNQFQFQRSSLFMSMGNDVLGLQKFANILSSDYPTCWFRVSSSRRSMKQPNTEAELSNHSVGSIPNIQKLVFSQLGLLETHSSSPKRRWRGRSGSALHPFGLPGCILAFCELFVALVMAEALSW